ncbi:Uncharacterised protein [Enterobacter cloacae]|nr:Uncharacterised protein [Enterobacter cloacae]
MLAGQHKGHVFPPQLPHIAKTLHFQGMVWRRGLNAGHIANNLAVLLTKRFHKRLVH